MTRRWASLTWPALAARQAAEDIGHFELRPKHTHVHGEITHKGNSYPGEHPAIIELPLWNESQAVLAKNRIERATGVRAKHPSLLASLVFDENGERLTPTYAVKKGTRYRYYVSTALLTGAGRNRSRGRRIPAGNLEGLVINRLRTFLTEAAEILDAVNDESHGGPGQSQLIERGRQIAEELGAQAPNEVKTTLMTLLCRVKIKPDRIEIDLSRNRLAALLAGRSIELTVQDQRLDRDAGDVVTLVAPARLKRVGRELRMLVENSDGHTAADPSMLRIIARAHDVHARLIQNTKLTVHDIAREERVTAAYIYTLLRLPWLAPDITGAIVNGRQPQQLNAKTLMRQASRLPTDWAEQRTLLGFRQEQIVTSASGCARSHRLACGIGVSACKKSTTKWRPRDFRAHCRRDRA